MKSRLCEICRGTMQYWKMADKTDMIQCYWFCPTCKRKVMDRKIGPTEYKGEKE